MPELTPVPYIPINLLPEFLPAPAKMPFVPIQLSEATLQYSIPGNKTGIYSPHYSEGEAPIDLTSFRNGAKNNRHSFSLGRKALIMATFGSAVVAANLPSNLARAASENEPPDNTPSVPDIFFIGDSISVGLNEFGGLSEKMRSAGANFLLDAEVGRPLILAGCELPQPSSDCIDIGDALRAIDANRNAAIEAEAIVLALGTNDNSSNAASNLVQVARYAHEVGSSDGLPPVILVPELIYTTDTTGSAADKNRDFRDRIEELVSDGIDVRFLTRPTATVALSDGIHPTGSGARTLADHYVESIVPIAFSNTPNLPVSGYTSPTGLINVPVVEETFNRAGNLVKSLFGGNNRETLPRIQLDIALAQTILPQSPVVAAPSTEVTELYQQLDIPAPAVNTTNGNHPERPASENQGVFYENGVARVYLTQFTESNTVTVNEGFADSRNVGNGEYRQGNADFSTDGVPQPVIAPGPAIVHIDNTDGEGNKVTLEFGTDPTTGLNFTWYATHLSEVNVSEGQIVMPGEILGMSGMTGTATGIHNSVGVALQDMGNTAEYLNSSEALNVFDYFPYLNIVCGEDAKSDNLELCGPTTPGVFHSIPLHPDVLAHLGASDNGSNETDKENEPAIQLDVVLAQETVVPNLELIPTVIASDILPAANPSVEPNSPPTVGNDNPEQEPTDTNGNPDNEDSSDYGIILDPNLINWEEVANNIDDIPVVDLNNPQESPAEVQMPETGEDGLRGETIPEKIYYFLIEKGYTHAGAIGIMANLAHEGGFDPTRAEIRWKDENCVTAPDRLNPDIDGDEEGGTGGYGFGIAQWTLDSRQQGLQAYADEQGASWKDLRIQLEYLHLEMTTNSLYQNSYVTATTSSDIDEVTYVILAEFEQPLPFTDRGTEKQRKEVTAERRAAAHSINEMVSAGNFAGIDVACDNIGAT